MAAACDRIPDLGPDDRAEALPGLATDELDVVVIGGGVVGAGAALDAATRGLTRRPARGARLGQRHRQPLVASSIHGGLRYLEMLDFGLVREALARARPAARSGWRRTSSARCRSSTR